MIEYRIINKKMLNDNLLEHFNRTQFTNRVYYINDVGELDVKVDLFDEFWDNPRKKEIVAILRYLNDDTNGVVIGAYSDNKVKGFAAINGELVGSKEQYLNLSFLHVSSELRGQGIGKRLISEAAKQAKMLNAKKLYIGANPSVETIEFYFNVGCVLAEEIVKEVYNHEPRDLQLEYVIKQ